MLFYIQLPLKVASRYFISTEMTLTTVSFSLSMAYLYKLWGLFT